MTYARPPVEERLWAKVQKGDGCWEWQGLITDQGYGTLRVLPYKNGYVHRVSWTLANGAIPDGLCVLHRCDNRRCVRPDHLFLGTRTDNAHDRDAKGRGKQVQLVCKRGHAKTPENTYRKPNGSGGALCRECNRMRMREWRRMRSEKVEQTTLFGEAA